MDGFGEGVRGFFLKDFWVIMKSIKLLNRRLKVYG
jgi:hypothetical protein